MSTCTFIFNDENYSKNVEKYKAPNKVVNETQGIVGKYETQSAEIYYTI